MSDERLSLIRSYADRGWAPVPIPPRSKNPGFDGWEKFRVAPDAIEAAFRPGHNVGLILGEPSQGLVDVDLDCSEALSLASTFLPPTSMAHGRTSNPRSHWWYVCEPALEVHQFKDVGGGSIVEFRSTGGQTIVPPSLHTSGESITWELAGEPASVDGRVLLAQVERLAACALLARHWPVEGSRHEAALAVAGALLRHGWDAEQVSGFIVAAARVAGDPELRDRERAVRDTADNLTAGRACTGLPRLAEIVGDRVVERFTRWLGIQADQPARLVLTEPTLRPAIEERRPWRDLLTEIPLPVGSLPHWFARIVTHVRPFTPMFPDDWAFMTALPFWASCWPGVRIQNLNLAVWSLGVSLQGIGKNVATDELMRIARDVAHGTGGQVTLYTAGTPEGMWDRLAGIGKQMLCYHDEFGGFLKLLQRDHMSSARETLCSLYDGRIVGYQRAQKGGVEVIDPHVVVSATINRPDIVAYANRQDLSNGYLSRFLICAPDAIDVLPSSYPFQHDPTQRQLVDELTQHILRYRDVTTLEWQESGRRDPELLNAYRAHLGVGSGRTIDLDAVEDEPSIPAGRLIARVKKIAGLLELAERYPEMSSDQRVVLIRPEHVATAIDVIERSRAYTERMIAWVGESADVELSRRVHRLLGKYQATGLSQRDICMRVHAKSRDVQTALQLLETDGSIERRVFGRVERWFPAVAA